MCGKGGEGKYILRAGRIVRLLNWFQLGLFVGVVWWKQLLYFLLSTLARKFLEAYAPSRRVLIMLLEVKYANNVGLHLVLEYQFIVVLVCLS